MKTDYLNKENYFSSGLSGLPPAFLCRLEETIVLALSLSSRSVLPQVAQARNEHPLASAYVA